MTQDMYDCAICRRKGPMKDDNRGRDVVHFRCPACGRYSASGSAWAMLGQQTWNPRQIANVSGWVREHQGIELSANDIGWVREHQGIELSANDIEGLGLLSTPTVGERAAKVLIELARRAPDIGHRLDLTFSEQELPEWIGISWSVDVSGVEYLFVEFLLKQGLIGGHFQELSSWNYLSDAYITPQGHAELERIRTAGGHGSAIGFCAMWFSPKLLPVWTHGIEPAIRAAGYDAQRIDRVHHNNKIDDEIVALIRRSRFVVADFTGNRGGVYFEAGFAMGLQIPVVWTIRSGRFHRVHFDNRQYNFVDWSFENLPDFKSRLKNRIEATMGRGPLMSLRTQ